MGSPRVWSTQMPRALTTELRDGVTVSGVDVSRCQTCPLGMAQLTSGQARHRAVHAPSSLLHLPVGEGVT